MKKRLFFQYSFLLLCGLCTTNGALATEETSGPLDDHPEWLACDSSSECTSAMLGCYYWQPINKNYSSAAASVVSACSKSIPAGPQPTVSCVNHQCLNDPFTVRYWTRLEGYQKFQLVMSRVEACRPASGRLSNDEDSVSWTQRYEAVLDEQIRNHQFPESQQLATAIRTIVPCAELVAWEQGQEKWQSIQSKNSAPLHVTISKVQPSYPLDNLYPQLLAYAEVYQRCGQTFTMAGAIFSGDMHATFTLNADGNIDPASLRATYPGVAFMRPFLDCAGAAFKKLSFPAPQNHQPINIEALIRVQSETGDQ